MKIYINRKPVIGPWGGGNKFVSRLSKKLQDKHEVVYDLDHSDIDVIFCFDPRPNKLGENYQHFLNYKQRSGCKIIQRVGDLGTHSKPFLTDLVRQSINFSDFVIFPSKWAKEWIGHEKDNSVVVDNAPLEIFHKFKKNNKLKNKINIITHHWSTNPKKGFLLYKEIDDYIFDKNINFTFIGRLPPDIHFKNINYIKPISDNEKISKLLANSDLYITASREEAGANHVLEAMAAGLPLLYHSAGGSIVNYCSNYGLSFSSFEQLITQLKNMKDRYSLYKEKVLQYNNSINSVIDLYEEIICQNAN